MLAQEYPPEYPEEHLDLELSPAEQFRLQWNQQPGPIPFWKQRNVIDQNAELMSYAGVVPLSGWAMPRAFALQGLVLVAFLLSVVNWYATRHSGKLEDQIIANREQTQAEVKRETEIMEATQAEIKRITRSPHNVFNLRMSSEPLTREAALAELNTTLEDTRKSVDAYQQRAAARETDLLAQQKAVTVANSGTPLIFSLALFMAAGLVLGGVQKDYPKNRQVRRAGDYYLYFATAEGLFPNLVLLIFLHFALSGSSYGFTSLFSAFGPIFWALFWGGFGFLLLRYFVMVARDMHKALGMRMPVNEWSFDNRILLRITAGFLMMFVCLEASFLSLSYFLYLGMKRG